MGETKPKVVKTVRDEIVQCTYGGLAVYVIIAIFFPQLWTVKILLGVASYSGTVYSIMTHSKYNKIFKLLDLYTNRNVAPLFKYSEKTNVSQKHHFTLPCSMTSKDFEDKQLALSQYLGKKIKIKYTFKEIVIEEFEKDFITKFDYEPIKCKGNVPILCGRNEYGEIVSFDLASGSPHLLCCGSSGMGKSVFLRQLITNIILTATEVLIHLVDHKNGAEFSVFSKSRNVVSFSKSVNETEQLLEQLALECHDRYDLFYKNNVKDIEDYNKKFPRNKLKYMLLVVDEFNDVNIKKKDKESTLLDNLNELSRKSRACGIHMIIASQYISTKIMDSSCKSNFDVKVGFKTSNDVNSRLLIDSNDLSDLKPMGNGIVQRNNELIMFQAPYLDYYRCQSLISSTSIEEKDKNVNGIWISTANDDKSNASKSKRGIRNSKKDERIEVL